MDLGDRTKEYAPLAAKRKDALPVTLGSGPMKLLGNPTSKRVWLSRYSTCAAVNLRLRACIFPFRCSTLRPPTIGNTFGAFAMTYVSAIAVRDLIPCSLATFSMCCAHCSLFFTLTPTQDASEVFPLSLAFFDFFLCLEFSPAHDIPRRKCTSRSGVP